MDILRVKVDGEWVSIPSVIGPPGHSPAITASKSGGVTTIYADGVAIAEIDDGYDPSAKVTQTASGATITIEDAEGITTANIANGRAGTPGTDGVTFTPTVSSAGVISWTNDGGLPNPQSVDIKGPPGEPGSGVSIHICSSGEYDATTRVPTVQNPDENTFYLVSAENGASPDMFVEWIYANNAWEMFGSASVDLSGYQTKITATGLLKGNGNGGVSGAVAGVDYGTYTKPNGGIPASDLASGVVPVTDVQIDNSSILSNGTANIPVADGTHLGVVKATSSGTNGIVLNENNELRVYRAASETVKAGTDNKQPIVPVSQHEAAFYGLSKVAGADLANETVTVGTYPDTSKAAIQHMLGTDTNLAPYESDTTADAAYAVGEMFMLNGKLHHATAAIAIGDTLTVGTNCAVVNAAGVFPHDVQVNGTSVLNNGVANVPIANSSNLGVVKVDNSYGIGIRGDNHILAVKSGETNQIKQGNNYYAVVCAVNQHQATFYGLAKAAGDSTQSASANAVGAYTESAKSAIHEMLNGSVAVSGSTPTITALPGVQYECGEVSSLDIILPNSGIVDVTFMSGSTPTVLTITAPTGMTVEWDNGFDSAALDADTIYEVNFKMVGTKCLGVAGLWS